MSETKERDYKIEKINAYRKLLDVSLKNVTKFESIQQDIQEEFKSFIETQLNELMGEESSEEEDGVLSRDEVNFLKAFISSAQARANSTTSSRPATVLNKTEGTTDVRKTGKSTSAEEPSSYIPRNLVAPLGNRKMEGTKASPNKSLLDQLDEMDKKFENEF